MKKVNIIEVLNYCFDVNVRKFLDDAFKELHDSGITIKFFNSKSIKLDKQIVTGYFDDENKELYCIFLRRRDKFAHWLGIFIHEYCHFLQWKYQEEFFNAQVNNENPYAIMYQWLDNIDYSQDTIDKAFKSIIELEYDAEYKSLELIKKYNLKSIINANDYAKSAIEYFIFLWIVKTRRFWWNVNVNSEYKNRKKVWFKLPDKLSDKVKSVKFLNKWESRLNSVYKSYQKSLVK